MQQDWGVQSSSRRAEETGTGWGCTEELGDFSSPGVALLNLSFCCCVKKNQLNLKGRHHTLLASAGPQSHLPAI